MSNWQPKSFLDKKTKVTMAAVLRRVVAGETVGLQYDGVGYSTTFCASSKEGAKSDAVSTMVMAGIVKNRAELIRLQLAAGVKPYDYSKRYWLNGGRMATMFLARDLVTMAQYAAQHGVPANGAELPKQKTVTELRREQLLDTVRERRARHLASLEAAAAIPNVSHTT